MLNTTSWMGMPLITGTQTDVLLRIEDHLDNKEAVFIRLISGQTIVNRMRFGEGPEEDAVLVDDAWVAALLGFRLRIPVTKMDRKMLTAMVFNLSSDNGERVLVLSDRETNGLAREPDISDGSRQGLAACIGKLEASSPEAIAEALYKTGARVILSDVLPNLAFTLYQDVRAASGLQPVWIQVPTSLQELGTRRRIDMKHQLDHHVQRFLNRGKIALQVMTAELA